MRAGMYLPLASGASFAHGWMMKCFLALLLVCLFSPTLKAHVLGDVFSETPFSKNTKDQQVQELVLKSQDETRAFHVTFNKSNGSMFFKISKRTGRIFSITVINRFNDMNRAVAYACYICEGDVFLPEKASWGTGFVLKNIPGEAYSLKTIEISADVDVFSGAYTLKFECLDFAQ